MLFCRNYRSRKGQSAIEYLMTYGWMLLVVALVGGLLFALFQDQELETNTIEGFENSDVRVQEATVSESNFGVNLVNRKAEKVTDISICVYNSTISNCGKINSLDIGEEDILSMNNFYKANSSYEYDVNLSYRTDSGLNYTDEGILNIQAAYNDSTKDSQNQKILYDIGNKEENWIDGYTETGSNGEQGLGAKESNYLNSTVEGAYEAGTVIHTWETDSEHDLSKYSNLSFRFETASPLTSSAGVSTQNYTIDISDVTGSYYPAIKNRAQHGSIDTSYRVKIGISDSIGTESFSQSKNALSYSSSDSDIDFTAFDYHSVLIYKVWLE